MNVRFSKPGHFLLGVFLILLLASAAPAQTVDESRARILEVRVMTSWLADPGLCPYFPSARVEGDFVRVGGFVPNDELRQRTVAIAQRETGLRVVDQLTIHAGLEVNPSEVSADQLLKDAMLALKTEFRDDSSNCRLALKDDGHLIVRGAMDSHEKKLLVSERLRRIPGCICIINELEVRGNTGIADVLPPSLPARMLPAMSVWQHPSRSPYHPTPTVTAATPKAPPVQAKSTAVVVERKPEPVAVKQPPPPIPSLKPIVVSVPAKPLSKPAAPANATAVAEAEIKPHQPFVRRQSLVSRFAGLTEIVRKIGRGSVREIKLVNNPDYPEAIEMRPIAPKQQAPNEIEPRGNHSPHRFAMTSHGTSHSPYHPISHPSNSNQRPGVRRNASAEMSLAQSATTVRQPRRLPTARAAQPPNPPRMRPITETAVSGPELPPPASLVRNAQSKKPAAELTWRPARVLRRNEDNSPSRAVVIPASYVETSSHESVLFPSTTAQRQSSLAIPKTVVAHQNQPRRLDSAILQSRVIPINVIETQLLNLVRKECGQDASHLRLVVGAGNIVHVWFTAANESNADQLAARITNLPALDRYDVKLSVQVPQ